MARREGLWLSTFWVMIATLTTKSADHPIIGVRSRPLALRVLVGKDTAAGRNGGDRHARRLIRTCGGKVLALIVVVSAADLLLNLPSWWGSPLWK